MPPLAAPHSEFELWACARLRSLYEARCDDTRRGTTRKSSTFEALMRIYLGDYDDQPFSRSSWEGHAKGSRMANMSDAALRKRADQYLRSHSVAHSAKLTAFEDAGGIAADHPYKSTQAIELWGCGGVEGRRVDRLVCVKLGIPTDTPAADRPDSWISARGEILKREFNLLPEVERTEWQALARERRAEADAEGVLPAVLLQDRQMEFPEQLSAFINRKMARGGLGRTFVVQFKGFYIGEEDRVVHRFRGQAASYDAPNFYHTTEFNDDVLPLWTDFIRKQAEGYTVPMLPQIQTDPSLAELRDLRLLLKSWFELQFDFAVDMPDPVNNGKFWEAVRQRPSDFISDDRIPEGSRFGDPTRMAEDEFKILYRHVYNSQHSRENVHPDVRALFEKSAIEHERAVHYASRLKKAQAKRRATILAGTPSAEQSEHEQRSAELAPPVSPTGLHALPAEASSVTNPATA